MNLQNGYKVIYEKIADGKRTFLASKTGVFADAEVITEAKIGEYKLIYEKNGSFYGSKTGIPAAEDYCFEDLDKVFKVSGEVAEEEVEVEEEEQEVEVPVEDPEVEPTEEE